MEAASTNTNPDSRPRVRLLSSRPLEGGQDQPAATPLPELRPRPMEVRSSPPSSPAYLTEMLAVMSAIGMLLAARFLLLLAVLGSFVLASLASTSGDPMGLWVLAIYGILVVVPLIGLYWVRG